MKRFPQQLRGRRSPHVVPVCTDSPEFGHAGGGESGPAGLKATATVLLPSLRIDQAKSPHNTRQWALPTRIMIWVFDPELP